MLTVKQAAEKWGVTVRRVQDICDFFVGEPNGEDCYCCKHYRHVDDLLGICVCAFNKKQVGKTNAEEVKFHFFRVLCFNYKIQDHLYNKSKKHQQI